MSDTAVIIHERKAWPQTKNLIVNPEKNQYVKNKLSEIGVLDKLFELTEGEVQSHLASPLRALAIKLLRNGPGITGRGFRAEYAQSDHSQTHEKFLNQQAKSGTWGTYIEATALAEFFGCHLVVTPITKGVEQDPICLYRAEKDNAPVIHLFNTNNQHWFVNNQTKGQGNCLYNALAQALQGIAKHESYLERLTKPTASDHNGNLVQNTLFKPQPQHGPAIELQRKIEKAIKAQPTPQELETQFQVEKERIVALSPEEQEQIAQDHELALKLAGEEWLTAVKNRKLLLNFCPEKPAITNKLR